MITAFAQAAMATVFGYAFYGKVRRSQAFLTTVQRLMMRSGRSTVVTAAGLAVVEAVAAVLVAVPPTARAGFALGAALLVFFIGVVVRAVRGGVFAECRCFGDHGSVLGYPILIRNALLLAIAVTGLLAHGGYGTPVPTVCAAVVGAVGAAAFVRYYDDLVNAVLLRLYPSEAGGT
ncbi:MauE/DoxX family redox-associated membrane protein [Thermomonospora umbrina]|uniref:Methylamine utilization protein MauE n=1 Tax=Thermomonospora umbrina TaxID=111806 RepID=A0A3D9SLV7_9ACTN|nr:MauE/DoxX family redox-associated membrane protein [Thermomonospora umbrina]REE96916.1 methylamine utilization protein MauE [Thermomonospora umbrina]